MPATSPYAASSAAGAACMAFVLLIFATVSPWIMYSTFYGFSGMFVSFGAGPFVAGASTGMFAAPPRQYYGGVVWWSDLTTHNVCQTNSSLYEKWSLPNGLCPGGEFAQPAMSQAIQACTVLATVFSFFALLMGLAVMKTSKRRASSFGAAGAACCSLTGMIFTIASFAMWTTWDMSLRLQSAQGDYIPLYATVDGQTITIEPSPKPVTLFYGWTFITSVLSFVLLLGSTCTFCLVTKQGADEEEFGQSSSSSPLTGRPSAGGEYGSGTGIGVI